MDRQIIYEQPLNELMRLSLRLEYVFQQIDVCQEWHSVKWQPTVIIGFIVDLLNLLDRPDFKPRLTKELSRYLDYFSKVLQSDSKDAQPNLQVTLQTLQRLLGHFLNMPGKVAQCSRDNEFLGAIRHNALNIPIYRYWVHQPESTRLEQVQSWLGELAEVREAVALLLNIVRESAKLESMLAQKGFYHEVLSVKSPTQLLRIALPTDSPFFPEISAGKHRMSIRFMVPGTAKERSVQATEDVAFGLAKCMI